MHERLCRVFLALAFLQATSFAQRTHLLPIPYGAPVADEPFSATLTLDYEPAANSSDPTAFHAEEKVFRDSQGRTRVEMNYPDRLPTVDIYDCIAHLHYRWTVGDTVALRFPLQGIAAATGAQQPLDADAPQIEGIPTRSYHFVTGKTSVGKIVDEWYSPDLRLNLLTIDVVPGAGKTTYRYSHIDRTEPPSALFQVPVELTIDDGQKAPPPPAASAVAPQPSPASPKATQEPTQQAPLNAASANIPTKPAEQPGPRPAYLDDPKFQNALTEAKDRRQPADEQLARWKNANKIAKGQCIECLRQIIGRQIGDSQWKDAIGSATQLEDIATDPRDKFFANVQRGLALLHTNNDNPKPDQVNQAEASFRAALAISPKSITTIYSEGRALALQGHADDAKAMFTRYVELAPYADRYRTRAEHFIENPQLAAVHMAPPFTLTTSEGEQISLDDMNGKVVLLDFWATWCGPCRETLPIIQGIAKKFAGQPLVVISISSDSNAAAWQDFVAKNHMDWPQYRDANHALQSAYAVNVIPQFFTIDTDGALQSVKVGSGADIEGGLKKLVKRATEAEQKKAKDTDHAPAGQ